MKRSLLLLIALVVPLLAPQTSPACPGSGVILVLGDSLSAGYGLTPEQSWPSLLENRLERDAHGYRVVNASIRGDTTRGGRSRLPRALKVHSPDIVVVELGGNDGLRGLPLDAMRSNLEAMLAMIEATGARAVLVGMHIPPNYGPDYTQGFYTMFGELAERFGAAHVPFLLDGVALDADLMQADGIHPNATAQPTLLDNVWPALAPLLAEGCTQAADKR
ncbi:MAG: arylesterase [Pseudomonadota bacterium]